MGIYFIFCKPLNLSNYNMAFFISKQTSSKTAHGSRMKMTTIVVVLLLAAAFDNNWAGPILSGATTVRESELSHTSVKNK